MVCTPTFENFWLSWKGWVCEAQKDLVFYEWCSYECECANICLSPCFQFFGGIYPEAELLDYLGILCSIFFETPPHRFPQQLHHCTFSPAMHWGVPPVSPCSCQCSESPSSFPSFLIIVILVSVKWYLLVALICIPLVISDIEHLFLCLLVIHVSSMSVAH